MGHRSLVHRLLIVLMPAVLVLAMLGGRFALPLGAVAAPPPADADSLPECPRQWERLPKALGGRLSSADGFPVVGTITDVPEFHDCQRLIMPDGKYGPLVAVFAAYNLDTLQTLVDEHTALAGALILDLSLHQDYSWLHIRTGYNCLYMWTTPHGGSPNAVDWHARVLWVDTAASRCLKKINPGTPGGLDLEVQRPISDPADTAIVPPVARWDWDNRGQHQYIGIRCGYGWCEVGPPGFTPSPHYSVPLGVSSHEQMVRSIKGWYDQQELADVGSKHPIKGLVGTVFPGLPLDSLLYDTTAGRWFEAAYINISESSTYYKNMLNLDAVSDHLPFARMNILLFCHGRRDQCIKDAAGANSIPPRCGVNLGNQQIIWAQIKPALGGKRKFGCVKRYDHSMELNGKQIPNTARWRWLLDDETIWKECIQGCCEVESSTS